MKRLRLTLFGLILAALLFGIVGFQANSRVLAYSPLCYHGCPPAPISASAHWQEDVHFVFQRCFDIKDNPLANATDDVYVWGYNYLYGDGFIDYALNGHGMVVPIDQRGRYDNISCG